MTRGAFIVFEGCDKSGKSTQCKKLVEYLASIGKSAELWRFPDRTTDIGQVINAYISKQTELEDRAVHLLFSANRWELVPSMKKKLKNGVTLIVDRYAYSGVAFTAAKGYDVKWCKTSDVGLPRPDAVFYMDVAVEEAVGRGGFGGERYEVSEFQKKAQHVFETLKEKSWKIIDGRDSIEVIHKKIREEALKVIGTSGEEVLKDDLFV